jgi:hypothetical protein
MLTTAMGRWERSQDHKACSPVVHALSPTWQLSINMFAVYTSPCQEPWSAMLLIGRTLSIPVNFNAFRFRVE